MNKEQFLERYAIDRKGTNSLKWDKLEERFGDADLLAAWVADMEFKAPEQVIEALKEKVDFGVFGYTYAPESYFEAFINWERERHGYEVKEEWMRFSTGVVTALYWFVNAFTKPQDAVIILSPVYYPFANAVKDTGRTLISSELINTEGIYTIDFEDFEKQIIENDVKLFIHCTPHNPVGRVWTAEEAEKLLSICEQHDVLIVSDEIHHDMTFGDHTHIPSAIVSGGKYAERVITVTSASKTFNLAGLLTSQIIIENEALLKQFDTYVNSVNQTEVNMLGMTAAEAAYNHGVDWLEGLREVVKSNERYAVEQFAEHAPKLIVTPLEGTYLLWIDLRAHIQPDGVKEFVQDTCKLAIDYGEWFGENSKGFIRLNLGTKPHYIKQAVDTIIEHLPQS
ncbi:MULTISPECIES: MalY/PatB family protein [unclassified Sporosarcina]|uniref:MalY/PatB family protein n=1 Tax=unclassified Sporosarcina TaxID=2647733 RepID=UPI000C166617|nr:MULTISPECIES: MalY/PatB family protein [unclassified Sporosarcina]PID06143.1 aminotransferase [Sporosarcina sp. P30]PID09337.1 aminotransferase [Sporosarcina sp. P31]PID12636.1 aminotransferase [Sporosarcina sp. P32b]